MELKEQSFEILYKRAEPTDFITLIRPMIKVQDKLFFYDRISDLQLQKLFDIELLIGYKIPRDYINLLKLFNGGKIGELFFYPVDNENEDTLYNINFKSSLKEDYDIDEKELVIASSKHLILSLGIDEEGYYFYKMYEKSRKKNFITANEVSHIIYFEIDRLINA